MFKKLLNIAFVLPVLLASGCSSNYEPRESIVDEQKAKQQVKISAPQTVQERRAYEKGVQDVLVDMKGKMRARDRFTWEAPIIQCGVQIPGRVVNGMLVPSHEECVQIAPGRFIEEAPTYLPALGASND
ncbi:MULTISPECIES: hypothetical protein [Pseudomonas]|uniref:hypothetical protein n=1 Tax=Pseudomonas TaxID=286 RepID=UPI0009E76658|nr:MULTISPECIES: hypothetical protein [Pseudomonas]PWD02023.1 hypothetical protein CX658_18895 [Pseudomonas amygdali pv. lachrymans]WHS57419.1 hypothetical protein QLH64_30850 [Pseudomonas brassicacearum]WNZ87500.1 hypothetical protein QOM10_29900 [Pseudomonas sp. P108]